MNKKYLQHSTYSLLLADECSKIQDVLDTFEYESLPCLCGHNSDYNVIAKVDRYGLRLDTIQCLHCGSLRSSPYMTQDSLEIFYQKYYRDLYSSNLGPERIFSSAYERGVKYLAILQKNLFSGDVLEIGAGTGGGLMPLHENGYKCVGCDYGEDFLDYGLSKGLNLKVGSYEQFIGKKKFDLVILSHVFEHFIKPKEEIKKIKKLLAPNGLLLIEVPGLLNIKISYRGNFLEFLQGAHPYHYTKNLLHYLVVNSGFQILSEDEGVCCLYKKNNLKQDKYELQNEYETITKYLRDLKYYNILKFVDPEYIIPMIKHYTKKFSRK
ncbi:class I SAM-dependent methyltransferase [Lentisphaera profundi]|uniref:Class I SAM-dependent methyltransferase n=1 Tax=Lentisphaera profundi TaxID=1658616 RepID=A0ABY7VPA5_9BACT|nr:class I SAM-dependent methyltransferase [Lentisphaera profundi]WDE95976.1 class I SAM-dependent methyltransferase [Lentisphaera profundi]